MNNWVGTKVHAMLMSDDVVAYVNMLTKKEYRAVIKNYESIYPIAAKSFNSMEEAKIKSENAIKNYLTLKPQVV